MPRVIPGTVDRVGVERLCGGGSGRKTERKQREKRASKKLFHGFPSKMYRNTSIIIRDDPLDQSFRKKDQIVYILKE